MTDTPEEGRIYSLSELSRTGSWAKSDVTAEVKLAETFRPDPTPPVHVPDDPDGIVLQNGNPYRVGSIWRTSWGYDQTNVEYYQVVRETRASVWVREIQADLIDRRVYPVSNAWVPQRVYTGAYGEPESVDDEPTRRPEGEMHRKGRDPAHPHITFESYRYAWPYKGGGAYDTLAAGEAGH